MPNSPKKPVDCSELAASLAELALAHGEVGAKTLDEVVAAMRKDLPEVDRDTIADAIVAFTKRDANPETVDEVKARIAELKKAARKDASLRKQIDDLKNKRPTDKEPREKKAIDDRIAALEAERDKLRKDASVEQTETRMAERLSKQIESLEKRLEEGDLSSVPPREKKVYSDKIEALRTSRDRLQSNMRQVKREADFENRIKAQIDDLTEQLESGVFKTKEPRAKRVLNKRLEQLVYNRDKLKKEVNQGIEDQKEKGYYQRFVETPFNEMRALMTTGEFSAVGRQGGFLAIANPIEAAKIINPMLKAFSNPATAHKIELSLRPGNENSRPNAMLYDKAGLHLPDPELNVDAKRSEEAFQSNLPVTTAISRLTHIPADQLVHASGRAYITFLNMQRANRFDALAETLAKNGEPTLPEAKAIAHFINAATGRGNLGDLARASKYLNTVFFAPRYVTSRFEMLYEPIRAAAATAASKAGVKNLEGKTSMWGGSRATDLIIAREYAKYAAGMSIILGIASQIPGVDVEWDPRSTDFGKIRVGDTRLDMLSGLQQATVFLAKSAPAMIGGGSKSVQTGEVESLDPRRKLANAVRFARTKLSPMVGTALDLWTGEDVTGNPVMPLQSPAAAGKFARNLLTPITWNDIYKIMTGEMGIPDKAALSAMAILGAGVQSYDALAPKTPAVEQTIPKEERDLDPSLPKRVNLTHDEYDKLLKAHQKALEVVKKERKKPYFAKLSQKEQAAEIETIYKDEFEAEKDDIVLDAVDRISKPHKKSTAR